MDWVIHGGHTIQIDPEDLPRVERYPWYRDSWKGYVRIRGRVRGRMVTLSRFLLKAPLNAQCDHISGDTLDNRRSNLRLCSQTQNARNRKLTKYPWGEFKGISKCPGANRYEAYINVDKKRVYLGTFKTKTAAAGAYNAAARIFYKEFARYNNV